MKTQRITIRPPIFAMSASSNKERHQQRARRRAQRLRVASQRLRKQLQTARSREELGVRALAAKGFSRKLQEQFEVEIRLARKRKLPAADVPGAPVRRPMRPSKAVVDARYVREYYLAAAARLAMLRHRLGRQAGTPWMSPELPAEVKKRLKNKKINNAPCIELGTGCLACLASYSQRRAQVSIPAQVSTCEYTQTCVLGWGNPTVLIPGLPRLGQGVQ